MRVKVVTIMAALFEVLVLATKEVSRGRFKSYLKQLVGTGSPVKPALERLKALALAEERQAVAEIYGGVAQLNVKTDNMEGSIGEIRDTLRSFRSEYKERMTLAHQESLRDILDPSPFPEDFYSWFKRTKVDGTGEWLMEDEGVQSWVKGEKQHLWMSGGPGTGKSYLSTKLITWGRANLSHVAYFYFRANNPETRSVLQALRDVAYQLSESDAIYGRQLMRRVRSSEDIKTIPSAFRRLFVEPFMDDSTDQPLVSLHVVLDGIDEADPDEIEELLSEMEPKSEPGTSNPKGRPRVQVALVGRPYMNDIITSHLDPVSRAGSFSTIVVTHDRNAKDVRTFIEDGVDRSKVLRRREDLKRQVKDLMIRRADGLFILAKFMLADVNRASRASTILKSLQSFPREINGMLHKTLENLASTMTEEDAADLNEMLQWITCAEQSLTLEQLEAVLILRFDETPFRFEDTLRGQYSCFFELEREDGLTTDDLIKDREKRQRSGGKSRDSTPSDRPRRSSSAGQESPSRRRNLSPAQQIMAGDRTSSLVKLVSSPPERRDISRSRSPHLRALVTDSDQDEMEFRSKKSTTTVTFFHTSVREFFRDEDTDKSTGSQASVSLGFRTLDARLNVLKTCLRIFNDKAWFDGKSEVLGSSKQSIKQYAAWYWEEHLAAVDPSSVSKEDKKTIGAQVYRMITDESLIYEWSIMYEKNDESTAVFTDSNLDGLRKWMADPDVLASLEPSARKWAEASVSKPTGIVEVIGRYYARAWVDEKFKLYVPTKFCFRIVQNLAFMDCGHSWSDSQRHWADIPFTERIKQALEWAQIKTSAHYFRRVGGTFLGAGLYNPALQQYNEALKLDPNNVETSGRKAYCLWKGERWDDALQLAKECESIEKKSIADEKLDKAQLAASRWRLYKDQMIVADCSYHLFDVNTSIAYYHEAMNSAAEADVQGAERFDAEIGLLDVLADENRHADMMTLLEDLSLHRAGRRHELSQLIDLLLNLYNRPLLMDSIPKAACTQKKSDFLLDRLEICIDVADTWRDPLKALYLRIVYGTTLMYARRLEEALRIFEKISLEEYRPRGNVATRQAHALSFQRLATLYRGKVLHAGVSSAVAQDWVRKLEAVQAKQSAHENQDMPANMLGSDVNVAAIYLGRFYRLCGREKEAERLLAALIVDSCEILEDEDLRNDEYALENLLRLFAAADDVVNAEALAVSMRQLDPNASIQTPLDSPVRSRDQNQPQPPEPKLTNIQSSNRSCAQCLNNISPSEEYHFCRYCLDTFCPKCMKDVIKKKPGLVVGNDTKDLAGDAVVCRADHEWIAVPPLRRVLHTGQILFPDGEKRGFVEWRDGIKSKWAKLA